MKQLIPALLALAAIALAALPSCKSDKTDKEISWKDTSLSPEVRAAALVSELTLEEKTALVQYNSPAIPRLGIRAYNWWSEALHGVARNGSATVFPQPIGLAATFDPELIETVFTAVSDEGRVKYRIAKESGEVLQNQGLTFWTPNINIFRDPRWGRGMETYGEDPWLMGEMGSAVVRGLQGDPDARILKAHACAKHYAVHSGLESNRHRFDARISERDLRETYLPAFKTLVTKAGVKEVMTAYNSFRGYPCAASPYLVKDILRGEWGYKGIIVSDCWAISDLHMKGHHEFVSTEAAAAAAAVANGVDVECGSTYVAIPEAVRTGLLDEADLDRNLTRVLAERFRLGEMDDDDPWAGLDPAIVEGPEHRALSLEAAHESMVLLKNDGVLPLKADAKIALIGPNADDAEMQWGNYNPIPNTTVTLLDAMRGRVPGLVYDRACGLIDAKYQPADQEDAMRRSFLPALDLKAVMKKLEGVEVVVFAGGISPLLEGEEMSVYVPGFSGGDRTSIELPEVQRTLLKALHDAGKQVVLVNFSGSALGLVPESESCNAILQAWYPGQEGGTAIADVLFGDVNPSGKLPVTFYRNADQLPEVEDYDMEGHTYRYFRGEPLYPFGYGLSYTGFSFGTPKFRGKKLEIEVTNTGEREGTEVVQFYVRRPDDVKGPVKALRGIKRVTVPAGETVTVRFPLTAETFEWWNESRQEMRPLKGSWELLVGSSSAASDLQKLDYKF